MSHDLTFADLAGEHAALLLPVVDEDAEQHTRESVARRRITATTGMCPCGARWTPPNRAERRAARKARRAIHVTVVHEDDCPAVLPGRRHA